jgi:hypothetical protein
LDCRTGWLSPENHIVTVRFTAEAIPLAVLWEPFFRNLCVFAGPSRCVPVQLQSDFLPFTHRKASLGMGASPAGIEVSFLPSKRIQPFFAVRGGFLYFNRNVLNAFASQFNFTIDGRVGVRIPVRAGNDIFVAYMFQHFSNAEISAANPGMDSHMVAVSYSFGWPFSGKKR